MHGKQCRRPFPDFMRVSYTLSSTIPYPYMCYPETRQPLIDALKLDPPSGRHGIAVFVSNPTPWRKKYLKELMTYIHIDSYGDVLHNTDMPSSRGKGSDDFISVKLDSIKEKGYKCLIAFENSIFPEYVTEKIWHAYLSQTIPIYYGTSDVYDQVPGVNTFIDATKFDGR
ncbi:alpha-(1,3)-fucosyltransferase 10-like [Dysidea avara]|uniref:alpha-(1,3)-fucosyltransferase 10-like n=1 Tax=Dysidea avara TaxID=196820 RepID=UPI003333F6E8